jgi:hypothetical protein
LAWLASHSNLYGLARRVRYELSRPRKASSDQERWARALRHAQAHPEYCQPFRRDGLRTIFTPDYRALALDLDDPRIAEGYRIALAALRELRDRAAAHGARFLVVFIPTKEYVFREVCDDAPASYRGLTAREASFWARVAAELDAAGVAHADATPALRALLARNVQPYQVTRDGHPNECGQAAIAELVAARLAAWTGHGGRGAGER